MSLAAGSSLHGTHIRSFNPARATENSCNTQPSHYHGFLLPSCSHRQFSRTQKRSNCRTRLIHCTLSSCSGVGAAQRHQPLRHFSAAAAATDRVLRSPTSIWRAASRPVVGLYILARAATTEAIVDDYSADNFYEILGVSTVASAKEIKRAYYNLMKDFHPDLSGDDESTEFCMLLNDIYETLMDPERRATYDALAGFSLNSINPFADASLPADQVFVDEFTCIGCRNCTNVCPSSFAIEDEYGRARVMKQGVDTEDKLQEAIDTCPVNCIHWVTASQLSLLEATMARMERVAVWSLMSGGGGGRDVFNEASIAWEKRQALVRSKQQREEAATAWANWWSSVGASSGANMYAQAADAARRAASAANSGSYSSYDGEDFSSNTSSTDGEEYSGTKEGARIAKLAAKAARASRQWKSWQELQRRSRQSGLLLTASLSSQD